MGKKYLDIIESSGILCPRCGVVTQIRRHKKISKRELSRPFYYWQWYYCTNEECPTTVIRRNEFMVSNTKDHG